MCKICTCQLLVFDSFRMSHWCQCTPQLLHTNWIVDLGDLKCNICTCILVFCYCFRISWATSSVPVAHRPNFWKYILLVSDCFRIYWATRCTPRELSLLGMRKCKICKCPLLVFDSFRIFWATSLVHTNWMVALGYKKCQICKCISVMPGAHQSRCRLWRFGSFKCVKVVTVYASFRLLF